MNRDVALLTLLFLSPILLAVGCTRIPAEQQTYQVADQCLRREIFQQCLATIPKGPERTVYNDWAEVVNECESAAAWQSKRPANQVKIECRSH